MEVKWFLDGSSWYRVEVLQSHSCNVAFELNADRKCVGQRGPDAKLTIAGFSSR